MATRIQIVFDCADPDRLTPFWADALGYKPMDPPAGFDDWLAYWRSLGVPDEELQGATAVHLVDPDGVGPRLYFQQVPEPKVVKNRLHLDLDASGGRAVPLATRRRRVDAEAARLVGAGATRLRVLEQPGVDHYAVVMQDPEGNEFCLH
jgi:Glyoxalase-like domain